MEYARMYIYYSVYTHAGVLLKEYLCDKIFPISRTKVTNNHRIPYMLYVKILIELLDYSDCSVNS